MTTPSRPRVLGLPLDRLLAVYLLIAAAALAFPGRPSYWPLLLAAHLVPLFIAWPPGPVRNRLDARSGRSVSRVRAALDWAPLLLVPALYTELAVLNTAVHGGRYFDDVIIAWEQAVFRGQPSRDWAAAMPEIWLSEPLHFAYLTYYFIIFLPPIMLFVRNRTDAFRIAVFTLMLSFFLHYIFFIYFPVQGPRYLFPAPAGELEAGMFYQLAHRVLEAGSAQGAAFPSSHVGVSVAQTLLTLRYLPRLAPLIAVLTVGLSAGAVYGGFHYATDALAGLVLGGIAFAAAPAVRRALGTAPTA